MENRWLTHAKRLQAIASTGVFFAGSPFDKERYEEIAVIANTMLADLGNKTLAEITHLMTDFGTGYITPKVDVRAAIIRGSTILLVQEKLDGLWTLPGGYADVALSAAENVVTEVEEESGLQVKATKLVGVFHKAKHEYNQDARDFYKFYFLCDQISAGEPTAGIETSAAEFFKRDQLPSLSMGRSIDKHISLCFEHHSNPTLVTSVD